MELPHVFSCFPAIAAVNPGIVSTTGIIVAKGRP